MDQSIVYGVQQGYYWDWKVALDLFFGGAGVGAFVFAVGLHELWGRKYRRIPQTAAFLAPVLVGAGLLMLMLKLGRPQYIFETFMNFAPTSPLWWGGIFQTVFLVGSIWYALLWRDQQPNPKRRRLGLALTPIALVVGAYHGMLLAVLPSRPLWNTGPTVVAALAAFVTTGIAAVMIMHLLRMRLAGRLGDGEHVATFLGDLEPVRSLLGGALLVQLGTFFLWWLSLRFGDLADRDALAAANDGFGPMFWSLGIGVGLVLPLAIGAYAVWKGDTANPKLHVRVVTLTCGLILVGGLFFRLAVVLAGQLNPVYATLL
ncbi:MAG: NrfD/PsrC family molybdoenzyme membrane anchor subunit [Gemmatimonadota bacterium]